MGRSRLKREPGPAGAMGAPGRGRGAAGGVPTPAWSVLGLQRAAAAASRCGVELESGLGAPGLSLELLGASGGGSVSLVPATGGAVLALARPAGALPSLSSTPGGCRHQDQSPRRLLPHPGGSAGACRSGQLAVLSRWHMGMSPSVFVAAFAARCHPERCWQLPAPLKTPPSGLGWPLDLRAAFVCPGSCPVRPALGSAEPWGCDWVWALGLGGSQGAGRPRRCCRGCPDGSSRPPALSDGHSLSAGTPRARLSMGTSWWPSSRRRGRWRGPAARSHTARRR